MKELWIYSVKFFGKQIFNFSRISEYQFKFANLILVTNSKISLLVFISEFIVSSVELKYKELEWEIFCKGTITQIYSPKISFHRFKSTAKFSTSAQKGNKYLYF